MRIAFLIYSLGCGGAERNAVQMAGYWVAQGHAVTILTLAGEDVLVECAVPDGVEIIRLGVNKASSSFFEALMCNMNRIRRLRTAIRTLKPDMMISFMETTNILCLLAAAGTKTRIVVADRNDPQREYYGRFWRALRNLTYPLAHRFVVQTRAVLCRYPRFLATRAAVIPNPLITDIVDKQYRAKGAGTRCICAMGRLVPQKGFDILLDAFAPLAREFPGWFVAIWGDGPEKAALEARAVALEIPDRVKFMGRAPRPAEALAAGEIFVLPSRWEGFPNVLVEAMAAGLPAIAADCPVGPAEIIEPGETGLLVPTEDAVALRNALRFLMREEGTRYAMGEAAREAVLQNYECTGVMMLWDKAIGLDSRSKTLMKKVA